jgi:plastocyanin
VGRITPVSPWVSRGILLLFLAASVSGCQLPAFLNRGGVSATKTPTDSVPSGQVNVFLQDYEFHPQKLTVKTGTTVTWINRDPVFHTVASDTGLFQSGLLAVGQTYSYTFDQPGTYPYRCESNSGPGGAEMRGEITVVD